MNASCVLVLRTTTCQFPECTDKVSTYICVYSPLLKVPGSSVINVAAKHLTRGQLSQCSNAKQSVIRMRAQLRTLKSCLYHLHSTSDIIMVAG